MRPSITPIVLIALAACSPLRGDWKATDRSGGSLHFDAETLQNLRVDVVVRRCDGPDGCVLDGFSSAGLSVGDDSFGMALSSTSLPNERIECEVEVDTITCEFPFITSTSSSNEVEYEPEK
jgi:hypothetical protein